MFPFKKKKKSAAVQWNTAQIYELTVHNCGPEAADTDSACLICHCVMCPCAIVCVLESERVTLTEGSSVL